MRLFYSISGLERVVRFLIGGGSAATLNLTLVYVGVEFLGFRSDLQQNYVNVSAMEISLVYSFFIYRAFVWRDKTVSVSRIFLRQLPTYHVAAGTGLLARVLLFPVLQAFGVYYLLNIVLGILAGAAINYVLSDRYVFKDPMGNKIV